MRRNLHLVIALLYLHIYIVSAQASCFRQAAEKYKVNETILISIAKTESGFNPSAININTNGSRDIGIMQINSTHLAELRSFGITENTLLNNPCVNIHIGAWILAKNMAIHGNTWKAIGAYNTGPRGNPNRQAIYAAKINYNLYR